MAPPKLKFSDYDALGFDLDHTVSKYNLPEMYEVSSYSVTFHKKMYPLWAVEAMQLARPIIMILIVLFTTIVW